jgi:glycosyltransferase involved in cell wall biosynthesis
MRKDKRLLTVSPYCVYPPTTGGPKRIFYLNRGLARNGWEVFQFSGSTKREGSLLTLLSGSKQLAPGYIEYKYFNPLLHYTNRVLVTNGFPYMGASLLPHSLVDPNVLRHKLDEHHYVMLEHPYMYRQIQPYIRKDQLLVLNAHNIEFKLFDEKATTHRLMRAAVKHLFELERECFRAADLTFVCSEEDKTVAVDLFNLDASRIHIAPNGVDVESVQATTAEQRARAKHALRLQDRTVALFVGSKWLPNIEAVRELVKVAGRREDVHYLIVGGAGNDFSNTNLPNLTFTGFVEDLQQYIDAADLAVNPMVSGGGSNIKMFEYLAAGLPVVSTPFGARGILGDTTPSIIEADIQDMPQRIAEVASEGEMLMRRRASARRLVETHYDWTAISSGMSEAILAAR